MLDVRKQRGDKLAYPSMPGTNLERIAVNLDNPLLADLNVRKALLMGIDRKAITDVLFEGQQEVAYGLLAEQSTYFNPEVERYPYDPEGVKQLLTESGWTPGRDGICVNDKGDRLEFDLATTAGNQTREQIALVIQDQLSQLCIGIKPSFVPLQEYNGDLSRKRQFRGLIMSSIRFSPSTSPRIALGSDRIPAEDNSWVGNNFSGYNNPEMDAALDAFEAALSVDEQKKTWSTIQKIFADDLPMLPLYFYTEAYVTKPDIKGFHVNTYDPLMIWAKDWYRE